MEQINWKQLYNKTNELTKVYSSKQFIAPEKILLYQNLIKDCLKVFIERGELHLGLKTFIDRNLTSAFDHQLMNTPFEEEESLEKWTGKVFKNNKFGMVLNYLELLNGEFTETLAKDVEPLFSLAGLPLGGISFLTFIGNYGFTPFGIHKDSTGEDGILFHLGPGIKKFYTWDDPKYNSLMHHTKVFHDVESMLPEATCYLLNPGDALFIPHNVLSYC